MKQYSKEFREQALELSDEIGLKKASEQLGIVLTVLQKPTKRLNALQILFSRTLQRLHRTRNGLQTLPRFTAGNKSFISLRCLTVTAEKS